MRQGARRFSPLILGLLLTASGAALAFRDEPKRPDEAALRKLIDQLGDDDFDKREAAAKRLREVGLPALPLLRRAAKDSKDAEVRGRAADLAEAVAKSAFAQVRSFDPPRLTGLRAWVMRVALTPDGKQAVTAGDRQLTVWDRATGKALR